MWAQRRESLNDTLGSTYSRKEFSNIHLCVKTASLIFDLAAIVNTTDTELLPESRG